MRYEYDTRVVGRGNNFLSYDHPFFNLSSEAKSDLAEITKEIKVKMNNFLKKHHYSGSLEFVLMDTGTVDIRNERGKVLVREIPTCRVDISIIQPMMNL